MSAPRFPELWKAGPSCEYVERPYTLAGVPMWQQCYVCGKSLSFTKDRGRFVNLGPVIRHKKCDPRPAK